MTLKCTNNSCRLNNREHSFVIPDELVMDEKYIAIMFCPKCKRELKRVE